MRDAFHVSALNGGADTEDVFAGSRLSLNYAIGFVFITMSSSSIPTPFHFPSAMRTSGTNLRFVLLFLVVACLLTIFFLGSLRHSGGSVTSTLPISQTKGNVDLKGNVIAPKLGNETAKYGPLCYFYGIHIDTMPGLS